MLEVVFHAVVVRSITPLAEARRVSALCLVLRFCPKP
jgi:hypothetical protein